MAPSRGRRAFAPCTVWVIGSPRLGQSMALVYTDGHSLLTSRIQRILRGEHGSLYVQTSNSLYQLERTSLSAFASPPPSQATPEPESWH
ncbi:MAG: hypothetical protein AB1Z98_15135 [Nannocystaceae bacterium]